MTGPGSVWNNSGQLQVGVSGSFNTLLIERRLLDEVGPFDPEFEFFEDWDLLIRLSQRARFHHHRQVTCEYRHFRTGGDQILGAQASQRPDHLEWLAPQSAQVKEGDFPMTPSIPPDCRPARVRRRAGSRARGAAGL